MKRLALVLITVVCLAHAVFAIDPPYMVAPWAIVSPYNVTFRWNPVSGATWYRVWASADTSPGTAVVDRWVEGVTSVTISNALPGGKYKAWMLSWGPAGSSAWSTGKPFIIGDKKELPIGAAEFMSAEEGYGFTKEAGALSPWESNQTWYAQVNIPVFSQFEAVQLYAYNTEPLSQDGPTMNLMRSRIGSATANVIATVDLSSEKLEGEIAGSTTMTTNFAVISGRSYSLQVTIPSANTKLCGARVFYWGE